MITSQLLKTLHFFLKESDISKNEMIENYHQEKKKRAEEITADLKKKKKKKIYKKNL